jgi:hypothetical protein
VERASRAPEPSFAESDGHALLVFLSRFYPRLSPPYAQTRTLFDTLSLSHQRSQEAGVVTLVFTNPIWVVKTRMCLQVTERERERERERECVCVCVCERERKRASEREMRVSKLSPARYARWSASLPRTHSCFAGQLRRASSLPLPRPRWCAAFERSLSLSLRGYFLFIVSSKPSKRRLPRRSMCACVCVCMCVCVCVCPLTDIVDGLTSIARTEGIAGLYKASARAMACFCTTPALSSMLVSLLCGSIHTFPSFFFFLSLSPSLFLPVPFPLTHTGLCTRSLRGVPRRGAVCRLRENEGQNERHAGRADGRQTGLYAAIISHRK